MAALTTIGTLASIAAAAASTYASLQAAKRKTPQMPEAVAGEDPAVSRAKAETEAAQAANSKLAAKNKARQASSLLAKDQAPDLAALGTGKTKLGQ